MECQAHDIKSLLFKLLDEFLFKFSTDDIVCRDVKILELNTETFYLRVQGVGETFSLDKHPQGCEIKAITYSNMQIYERVPANEEKGTPARAEVHCIVDI